MKGFQPGVAGATSEGYIVPPLAIGKCVIIQVRDCAWDKCDFREDDDTSTKGGKAVVLVAGMIRNGLFPLPYNIDSLDDDPAYALQIDGDDIVVALGASCVKIQVKCDFRGGEKDLGGTGNLFLQVAERNPLKKT